MFNYGFREPFFVAENNGLYITTAQMHFFLNRLDTEKKFNADSVEFVDYYKNCCLYNLVYDMMEEDSTCAKMYWDAENNTVSLAFPVDGEVADVLAEVGKSFEEKPFGFIDGDDLI